MLAALNLLSVLLGVGAGGLAATVVGLLVGTVLTLLGVTSGGEVGLVVGVVVGLLAGGWVAGASARHSPRFHGAVSGLGMAGLIVVMARLGGSPAAPLTVLWLALLSAVLAGASGWWAGKPRRRGS